MPCVLARYEQVRQGAELWCSGLLESFFDGVGKLFNNRVREHFGCNALYLGVGRGRVERVIERQDEIFALANVGHAFVLHLCKRALDCLTLRVENSPLR